MSKTLTAEAIHLSRSFYTFPCVKAIQKEFGFKGACLIVTILFKVTSDGFERTYDRRFMNEVASCHNGITPNLVGMVVRRMVELGLLDKEAFTQRHVVAIPSGNIIAMESDVDNNLPYFFINSSKDGVSSEEIIINSEETHIISEETINHRSLSLN